MEAFIMWVGFVGGWLLFAGSTYEALLELQDEDNKLDRIRAAGAKVIKPAMVSAWWWIVLPIKLLKEGQRRREYERRIIKLLTREDLETFASLKSKATAWWLVAVGGICIALKETYELGEVYHSGNVLMIAIAFGMFVLSLVTVAVLTKRNKKVTQAIR